MAKYVVIHHAVAWNERDELAKAWQHRSAKRGEEVEIPDDQVARFQALTSKDGVPRIGTREEYEAWVSGMDAPAGPVGGVTDVQLQVMTPEQVIAHLNNTNVDADRVLSLEESRPRPRKGIVDAAQRIIDARDEQI